jgi:hypothetical protein
VRIRHAQPHRATSPCSSHSDCFRSGRSNSASRFWRPCKLPRQPGWRVPALHGSKPAAHGIPLLLQPPGRANAGYQRPRSSQRARLRLQGSASRTHRRLEPAHRTSPRQPPAAGDASCSSAQRDHSQLASDSGGGRSASARPTANSALQLVDLMLSS